MVKFMYSIRDIKVESYSQPFFCMTKAEALRNIRSAMDDKSTNLNKYPEDFQLYEVGTFSEHDGKVTAYEAPQLVADLAALAQE